MSLLLREVPFEPYGPSHLWVWVLFVTIVPFLIRSARHHRNTLFEPIFRKRFAILILVFQVPLQIYSMTPRHWDLGKSLPLQLCDLAWMLAVYALWTKKRWAVGVTYYWALTLTSQALITPNLNFDFPHLAFIMFFGIHILVIYAAIYLTWGLRITPRWVDFRNAYLTTFLWSITMMGINGILGTNYLFVNRKPDTPSILDLLGDWPIYLIWEGLIIAVFWGLITWPWNRKKK